MRPAILPVFAALLIPTPTVAMTDGWKTYVNVRYAFRICYPSTLLIPQGEADNGDGQTFKVADGAELRAFGSINALDRTLGDEMNEQTRHYTGKKGRITYRLERPDWIVVSGNDGVSGLFYAKTVRREGQFVTFQIRYPKASAGRYKPVVERLASCLRLIDQPRRSR